MGVSSEMFFFLFLLSQKLRCNKFKVPLKRQKLQQKFRFHDWPKGAVDKLNKKLESIFFFFFSN